MFEFHFVRRTQMADERKTLKIKMKLHEYDLRNDDTNLVNLSVFKTEKMCI